MADALAAGTSREIGGLIDSRPLMPIQFRIIVICGLVMMLDGYDIQVMGSAVPSVAAALGQPASSFGLVLTAALAGIGLGAGTIAPLGDVFGRRPVMVFALALAGLATLATALSTNLTGLLVWRFVTGLGIGGSIANATALTAEYMPARKRTWLTCVMYCNVALGASFAGFFAPAILHVSDWRGLFVFGGAATLTVSALVFLGAPESLKFLIARRPGHRRIAATLTALAPGVGPADVHVSPEIAQKRSFLDLLGRDYWRRTLLVWTIYIFTSYTIYVLTSWLTTMLRTNGWPPSEAQIGGVLFQFGGVLGSIFLSMLVDRNGMRASMVLAYSICAGAVVSLMLIPSTFVNWFIPMLMVGFGISGGQCILIALAASFYPMAIRATGVGASVMVGRVGSISAPIIGAELIKFLSPVQVLGTLIIPAAICAACSLMLKQKWMTG